MHATIDTDALAELARRFEDGYTSEDFSRLARQVEDCTGLRLVCLWRYADRWGTGGDSTEHLLVEGTLHDIPDSLNALLNDGDPLNETQLRAEVAEALRQRSDDVPAEPVVYDDANWVCVDYGEAEAPSGA